MEGNVLEMYVLLEPTGKMRGDKGNMGKEI